MNLSNIFTGEQLAKLQSKREGNWNSLFDKYDKPFGSEEFEMNDEWDEQMSKKAGNNEDDDDNGNDSMLDTSDESAVEAEDVDESGFEEIFKQNAQMVQNKWEKLTVEKIVDEVNTEGVQRKQSKFFMQKESGSTVSTPVSKARMLKSANTPKRAIKSNSECENECLALQPFQDDASEIPNEMAECEMFQKGGVSFMKKVITKTVTTTTSMTTIIQMEKNGAEQYSTPRKRDSTGLPKSSRMSAAFDEFESDDFPTADCTTPKSHRRSSRTTPARTSRASTSAGAGTPCLEIVVSEAKTPNQSSAVRSRRLSSVMVSAKEMQKKLYDAIPEDDISQRDSEKISRAVKLSNDKRLSLIVTQDTISADPTDDVFSQIKSRKSVLIATITDE